MRKNTTLSISLLYIWFENGRCSTPGTGTSSLTVCLSCPPLLLILVGSIFVFHCKTLTVTGTQKLWFSVDRSNGPCHEESVSFDWQFGMLIRVVLWWVRGRGRGPGRRKVVSQINKLEQTSVKKKLLFFFLQSLILNMWKRLISFSFNINLVGFFIFEMRSDSCFVAIKSSFCGKCVDKILINFIVPQGRWIK